MEIIKASKAGFCAGVNYTVNKAKEILEKYSKVYALGDIVHNEYVINSLKEKGLITVDDLNEVTNGSNLIVRAHGEKLETYEKAKEKGINILDLTCGRVSDIHQIIEKEKNKSFILVIGKKNHPETIAHLSYAKNISVIETKDDVNNLNITSNNIYIVAQTTFNDSLFEEIVCDIKKKYPNKNIIVNKTICNATKLRQNEIKDLSKKVNKMIIIGGKNSSNTKELFMVAKDNCNDTYLIQDAKGLDSISFHDNDIVGISAGASTPDELINDVIKALQNRVK